jgi:hypothetical protein
MKRKTAKESTRHLPEWERLLSVEMIFQSHFPECILVGGTAAAIHAKHRVSLDAGYVLSDLKKRFNEMLKDVEREAGWVTKRIEPPVLILGHFQGVRTGIRQLIRQAPLETTKVRGLRIPTIEEMIRIKAYLIVKRNTTRDFIDLIALADHVGITKTLEALGSLDKLYPQEGENSISQQLIVQLAEPKPWDLSETDLSNYRALAEPYTDWNIVRKRAMLLAQKMMAHMSRQLFV